MIQLPQSPFWAKRKKQPPVSQPNNSSRSHEYLTLGEVERMTIAALVHALPHPSRTDHSMSFYPAGYQD
jgi:hypothetical protein